MTKKEIPADAVDPQEIVEDLPPTLPDISELPTTFLEEMSGAIARELGKRRIIPVERDGWRVTDKTKTGRNIYDLTITHENGTSRCFQSCYFGDNQDVLVWAVEQVKASE